MNQLFQYFEDCELIIRIIEEKDDKLILFIEDVEYINSNYSLIDLVKMILDIIFKGSLLIDKSIDIIRESKVDNPEEYKECDIIYPNT